MSDSKQMRVSKMQYNLLGALSKDIGVSRTEILSNVIALAKFLNDNNAPSIKIIGESGEEKEFVLPMLVKDKQ